MINRAASEISADRHADHTGEEKTLFDRQRIRGSSSRNLHHRRPDVIEELNFHHRLHPARGHAGGAAHDVRLAREN